MFLSVDVAQFDRDEAGRDAAKAGTAAYKRRSIEHFIIAVLVEKPKCGVAGVDAPR
jgi:hypothetical protein